MGSERGKVAAGERLILIVEDDLRMLSLMQRNIALRLADARVLVAVDGPAAWAA